MTGKSQLSQNVWWDVKVAWANPWEGGDRCGLAQCCGEAFLAMKQDFHALAWRESRSLTVWF